ncbi:MAG: pantetheine-phosphate adenylyltransferase [Ignavibacteria bacterium]|nr:MAG: pantetheine-phosphate adenylyltransferase [Ignavibacteria bacterium]
MRIAIYPGTFDPITNGHVDIIDRAREIFDRVIVAVAGSTNKRTLFSSAERIAMIREIVKKHKNVSVDRFDGLLVRYAQSKKAIAIVRGLRAVSDFEYEFQMALTNRKLDGDITTVFLMPHEKYTYLNSSIVRELATLGGDVTEFVPPNVRRRLTEKMKSVRG